MWAAKASKRPEHVPLAVWEGGVVVFAPKRSYRLKRVLRVPGKYGALTNTRTHVLLAMSITFLSSAIIIHSR